MLFKRGFIVFSLALVFTACDRQNHQRTTERSEQNASQTEPLRYGMVTGLRPEKVAYYKKLHANAWAGVLKAIREYNIRNYSIYLHEIEGKPYLFSYYEYVGDNYDEDMRKIAADSVTQRWWRETDPCQVPLPEAGARGKIWASMEEVFHTQ